MSDPVDVRVPALSDLAISLFLPEATLATTVHILALQANYVSPEAGDSTGAANFSVQETISFWPFLAGVDVTAHVGGATIVAFGSSLTDGDGSTKDANRRWPDVLAERLQKNGDPDLGVLNQGIIGNRLLSDSETPRKAGGHAPLETVFQQLGPALGQAGVARFERDVLAQAGLNMSSLLLALMAYSFRGPSFPLPKLSTLNT